MLLSNRTDRPYGSGALRSPAVTSEPSSSRRRLARVITLVTRVSLVAFAMATFGESHASAQPSPPSGEPRAPDAPSGAPTNAPPQDAASAEPAVTAPAATQPVLVAEPMTSISEPTSIVPAAPTPPPRAEFAARPGYGITVTGGDNYSLTIRPRIQLRDTLIVDDDITTGVPGRRNEIAIRALRLWLLGHVINRNIKYGIQLAFGATEFEKGNPSPIYDAFLDFTRSRNASVKVGQYFVPFDRLRTIREFALQTVDRSQVVTSLTLDRDIGVSVYSNDFLKTNGRFGYQLGIFGGEGRNQMVAQKIGFLYTARVSYRPFGNFDEDVEGDLDRRPTPKLMIGLAGAVDHNSLRVQATTGDYFVAMSPNYYFGDLDAVFKWRGFAAMAEVVLRYSNTNRQALPNPTMATPPPYEYTQRALGYVLQASYDFPRHVAVWGRYDELHTPWTTDLKFEAKVRNLGRTLAGGLNYYLSGHLSKVQLEVSHSFGYPAANDHVDFRRGITQVMLQIDATF